jgi:hypothetical protein
MRMPDQRTRAGRRDHAILLVLGETGIRNFELRTPTSADPTPPPVRQPTGRSACTARAATAAC